MNSAGRLKMGVLWLSEDENPYTGLEVEYWSDGWEDAQEDALQA